MFLGLPTPERERVYARRVWYLFSRDHAVIKIGSEFLEQKGNVLCVVRPTMHSVFGVYDINPLIASKLPTTCAVFHVLSLWVCPHSIMILRSKYQALQGCMTSKFAFRGQEPGNKASIQVSS